MYNEKFENALKFVLAREGGYSNHPNDLGGETNKGITHFTYDSYRKSKGLPKRSVKYITDEEIKEIYYKNYWLSSGADKLENPQLSAIVFDTAVNMGPSRARTFLNRSDLDTEKYLKLRKDKYAEFVKAKPDQQVFLKGWNKRVDALGKYASSLPYSYTLKGGVSYDEILDDNTSSPTGYAAPIEQLFYATEDIDKMSTEEFLNAEDIINNQIKNKIAVPKAEAQAGVQAGLYIYVDDYVRDNGTKVRGYYRRR